MTKISKQYFAKYILQEGEIKEGDIAQFWGSVYGKIIKDNKPYDDFQMIHLTGNKTGNIQYEKPTSGSYKLCLCSRDIQVGDKVQYPNGVIIEKLQIPQEDIDILKLLPTGPFKVIGEISLDALSYVKEGDEFDEDQVRFNLKTWAGDMDFEDNISEKDYLDLRNKPDPNYGGRSLKLQIKGPCGHFH